MLGDCVTEMELEYKRDLIAADSFSCWSLHTVGKEEGIVKTQIFQEENQ